MLHMIDTTTVATIFKGSSVAAETRLRAVAPSAVCISSLTRAELGEAINALPANHRLHLVARHFLNIVRAMPWDADAADLYAQIRQHQKDRGWPIGELDLMIAAHALSLGATLVTCTPELFANIDAPLNLLNWSEV